MEKANLEIIQRIRERIWEDESFLQINIQKYKSAISANEKEFYDKTISECRESIKRRLVQLDVVKMEPYLEDQGIHVNCIFFSDRISYTITKFNDVKVLEYKNDFYENVEGVRKKQHGIVVFDNNENVLLDIKLNDENIASKYLNNQLESGDGFYTGDPTQFLINGKNIVLPTGEEDNNYVYTHYRLVSDELIKIHTFTKKDSLKKICYPLSSKIQPLKLKNDNTLACIYGRLYSFSKGKFLNNLTFDSIFDSTFSNTKTPKLGCSADAAYNLIVDTMNKHDVLMGTFNLKFDSLANIDAIVFLDKNGNIVSDFIHCINFDESLNLKYVETSSLSRDYVTNETYNSVKKSFISMAINYIDETLEREDQEALKEAKRRKEEYRNRLSAIKDAFDIANKKTHDSTRVRKSFLEPKKEVL